MTMVSVKTMREIFLPRHGAGAFFANVILFGMALGCFAAVLNNYLVEVQSFNETDRGVLEFFREIPGLLLVVILAVMHRLSEWKILRIGVLVSLCGVVGLMFVGSSKWALIGLIMIWSTGEHILLPLRSSIGMHIATPDKAGASLGLMTSAGFAGQVIGGLLVAGLFFVASHCFKVSYELCFQWVWFLIAGLVICAFAVSFPRNLPESQQVRRPRLYFNAKYSKFYVLELFYGARKQIFLTFAPMVLILEYGMTTASMALLVGCCAATNIFCGPMVGKLIDKFGYRNIMIYDTVVLFFVCLMYGFSDKLFPLDIARMVVIVTFVLDAIISTSSMATSVYVREISDSPEEVTSTLSTGISVNHLISVLAALIGGWVWSRYGLGVLFSFAAIMAVGNSTYAWTLPRPKRQENGISTENR